MSINEIEDIIKPFWFKNISENNIQKCYNFLDDYYFNNKDTTNIKQDFIKYQSVNNFNTIIKYGILITIYKLGRSSGYYPNPKPELELKL